MITEPILGFVKIEGQSLMRPTCNWSKLSSLAQEFQCFCFCFFSFFFSLCVFAALKGHSFKNLFILISVLYELLYSFICLVICLVLFFLIQNVFSNKLLTFTAAPTPFRSNRKVS